MAEEADVDLVEIAPTAQPPVCRLMDYGKFKYQEQKRAHESDRLAKPLIFLIESRALPNSAGFETAGGLDFAGTRSESRHPSAVQVLPPVIVQ